jgi:hypothetical protein
VEGCRAVGKRWWWRWLWRAMWASFQVVTCRVLVGFWEKARGHGSGLATGLKFWVKEVILPLFSNSLFDKKLLLVLFSFPFFFISIEWLFIRECQSFYERKPSPTSWKLNPWKLSWWIWIGNQHRCWPPIPLHLICEERIMG